MLFCVSTSEVLNTFGSWKLVRPHPRPWMFDRPLLTCRNLATLCPTLQAKRMPVSHRTSFSKASSVPGSTQRPRSGHPPIQSRA